ncbi:hypothetical protein GBA52_026377 [Prunus armeniaca]|nr:hypothetical protein GBA52_026377 [Prunus armeniaca]
MDREQDELQFLGIFGICKEAYKIVFSWRKIFSQITLTLILPLSFIFLAHIELSNILLLRIIHNERVLGRTNTNSPRYQRVSDVISSEWAYYWLFKAVYFTFALIFSLLSTSAVVYTIACIYTGREITYRKVMSVVPKVWKRVMVTFLCTFLAFFAYNIVAFIVLIIWLVSVALTDAGGYYWFLSAHLVRHRVRLLVLNLATGERGVCFAFQKLVVRGYSFGVVDRVAYGLICLLLLFKLILFWLVIQTVLYFVCKSYHHENIDKSALSDHLEVYLGDYVPLTAKDVQLQQV